MTIKELFTKVHGLPRIQNPFIRKTIGIILVLVGFLALVTPLTPGAWLALIGLEMLGMHLAIGAQFKAWLEQRGWWKR
ncbi:hypothetical protein EBR66_06945 [bacterium]|nr:hypothetical protein [bacterium]